MAVKIALERRAHRGLPDLACPRFYCDYCGVVIGDVGQGMYMWDARLENEGFLVGVPKDLLVGHKGASDRAMCRPRVGRTTNRARWSFRSSRVPGPEPRHRAEGRGGTGRPDGDRMSHEARQARTSPGPTSTTRKDLGGRHGTVQRGSDEVLTISLSVSQRPMSNFAAPRRIGAANGRQRESTK